MTNYPKREELELVALDLDGTVICSKGSAPVSERLKNAIRKLSEIGLPITFVTGRTEDHAAPIAAQLGLTLPLVTYNGARVYSTAQNRILHQSTIPGDTATALCRWLNSTDEVVACYLSREERLHLVQSRCSGKPSHDDFLFGTPRHLVEDLASEIGAGGQVVKLIVSTQRDLAKDIGVKFGDAVQAVRTHHELVEILPTGVSKGQGLLRLCEHLGVSPGKVLSIGDQENDISSFRVSGYSVAMGDAPDSVKQAAKFVTQSFAEEGCAQALERLQ